MTKACASSNVILKNLDSRIAISRLSGHLKLMQCFMCQYVHTMSYLMKIIQFKTSLIHIPKGIHMSCFVTRT